MDPGDNESARAEVDAGPASRTPGQGEGSEFCIESAGNPPSPVGNIGSEIIVRELRRDHCRGIDTHLLCDDEIGFKPIEDPGEMSGIGSPIEEIHRHELERPDHGRGTVMSKRSAASLGRGVDSIGSPRSAYCSRLTSSGWPEAVSIQAGKGSALPFRSTRRCSRAAVSTFAASTTASPGRRHRTQTGRRVGRIAEHCEVTRSGVPDNTEVCLPGVDPNTRRQVAFGQARRHFPGGSDGTARMVVTDETGNPHRHDAITCQVVDGTLLGVDS